MDEHKESMDILMNLISEYRKSAAYQRLKEQMTWEVSNWAEFLNKRAKAAHGKLSKGECLFWFAFMTEEPDLRRNKAWLEYLKKYGLFEQQINADISLPKLEEMLSNISQNIQEGRKGNQNLQNNPETQEIPTIRKSDMEESVFKNALEKGYMRLENGCYHWNLSYALLAYMCGRLYCGDRVREDKTDYTVELKKGRTQMPVEEVKKLFGDVDVASNRYSLKEPPRNHWKIDDLFLDRASK